ncbi:PQQ-binding-like beta-propeller repeat protein [Phenylobacterium deserti]|uniref:Uncharacterized protein n=1 Tax=Phenylobacterium deserti TaxID=1914756 RepID=A0A328AC95_9CAUL|nr:PQQ-binding-like beta-propeller repeat protein [Phenylobacterium deserti]RAK52281.1 hypothetical protein DJ018_14160 [Phenylobacterium deserti]
MAVTFDPNILLSYYQARSGVGGAGVAGATGTSTKVAPTAPWSKTATPAQISETVKAALAGKKLVDENAAQLDLPGASADYKKLFALFNGLETLTGLANQMNAKNLTALEKSRISSTFAKGLAEISTYIKSSDFEQLRMTQGETNTVAKAKLTVPKSQTTYVTGPLTSSSTEAVPAFEGDVRFTMSVERVNVVHDVEIDLAGMGGTPRTLANVINYVNGQLDAAGVDSRLKTERIPAQEREVKVGSKTVKLPAGPDQWAMKVTVGIGEKVSFSAPAQAPAVYVAQGVGDPNPDGKSTTDDGVIQNQLLKFQTDTSVVGAPSQTPGQSNWVEGRVFAENLDAQVKTVRAQTVGPDGSVYMLADVNGEVEGQTIKGSQDVALLKYDSAGKLVYARTLGAAENATGLGLAVSADGKVAIAGAVKGALHGATEGALNSGTTGTYAGLTDSFVTVFNADGEELWTQRRGAKQDDEASNVAFGADGTVYVSGRSKSTMPGGEAIGGWDNYVQGFKADAAGKVQTLFTQSFGSAGVDRTKGLVVDGDALVTASVEEGRAVLRRFDLSSGAPELVATRDLGDLQGGDIAGLALDGGDVVLVGTTYNGALAAGTVTRAHNGGSDAFAARMGANLEFAAGDGIAYYGGIGNDKATSLAVADGKVFIGGSAGGDLPDLAPVGKQDGFLASLDVASGEVGWSRRFTGKDGFAAPTAIAVDTKGASVLDRMGLPTGMIDTTPSQRLTAVSAIRAGDQFSIRIGQTTRTVTIEDKDTLDTLATKIRRASGFNAKVTVSTAQGARTLKIEPINTRSIVEIVAGKVDKDALELLGIPEGVVRATEMNKAGKSVPTDGKGMLYGLGLPNDLNLSNAEQIRHALAEIVAAQGIIRNAYKDLKTAATPESQRRQEEIAAAAASGKVPTYLQNQISSYQAALQRLTGGG